MSAPHDGALDGALDSALAGVHDGVLDDVAGRVLDAVGRVPGAQASVQVDAATLALTRFADSAVHQNVADSRVSVRLRLTLDGGRTATASTTRRSASSLQELVDAAAAAARVRPPDPRWPGLTGAVPVPASTPVDEATAAAPPSARAEAVAAFVAAAGGLSCAGYVQTAAVRTVFADTAGQSCAGATTSAVCDGIARVEGADGVARQAGRRLSDLDPAALGARAAGKARAGRAAAPVDPGRYAVVLEPAAVTDVVAGLLSGQFNGRSVADGTSGLRLGEQQFDAAFSLVDDPLDPDATGLPFDTEGTPRSRLELVRAGVPVGLTLDRRTAAELGRPGTGSAWEGSDTWGPLAADPAVAPGSGGTVEDLVAGLERGLLVSDLWYTRVLDQKRSVWTGLTRNGVWLVEDGAVVRPVSTLRFTQSYLEALAPGAVTVGSVVEPQPRGLAASAGVNRVAVPALRLAEWNVTGNSAG